MCGDWASGLAWRRHPSYGRCRPCRRVWLLSGSMCTGPRRSRRSWIRSTVSCVCSGCAVSPIMSCQTSWRSSIARCARCMRLAPPGSCSPGLPRSAASMCESWRRDLSPGASGDRVKTDRRDAKRLVRLFAAGELSFAFVPSETDERFRDLVRCVEDARKDLMRSRHRLSKFLLRRGVRFPCKAWTQPHEQWLLTLRFDDALSQATFVDYLSAVQALAQRRRALIWVLEEAVPNSSHARVVERLRCFRGIDTLTAAGLCAEVGDFRRFAKPALLSGFLGVVPSEYTSDDKRVQGQITKAGPANARRLLVEAAHHYCHRPAVGLGLAARP